MNIVILGAGEIGTYLAQTLSKEEHNVIMIDQDPKPLEKLARIADVATRVGSGTDWHLLEELLEQSPHLFLALSSNDETNLVACTIAKNLGYPKNGGEGPSFFLSLPFKIGFCALVLRRSFHRNGNDFGA